MFVGLSQNILTVIYLLSCPALTDFSSETGCIDLTKLERNFKASGGKLNRTVTTASQSFLSLSVRFKFSV